MPDKTKSLKDILLGISDADLLQDVEDKEQIPVEEEHESQIKKKDAEDEYGIRKNIRKSIANAISVLGWVFVVFCGYVAIISGVYITSLFIRLPFIEDTAALGDFLGSIVTGVLLVLATLFIDRYWIKK